MLPVVEQQLRVRPSSVSFQTGVVVGVATWGLAVAVVGRGLGVGVGAWGLGVGVEVALLGQGAAVEGSHLVGVEVAERRPVRTENI